MASLQRVFAATALKGEGINKTEFSTWMLLLRALPLTKIYR